MTKRIKIIGVLILLLSSQYLSTGVAQESGSAQMFAVANVYFEQNATDGDVEVVFEVKGGNNGLVKLKVESPDGRTVIDFTAPNFSTLGIRQFRFESPEPKDVEGLKAAYPEGIYKFSGATSQGTEFFSEASLSHKLPVTVSFLWPESEAEEVSVKDLEIRWTPVENISAYIVEIDQEELAVNILVKLPGSVNKLAIPDGFLTHGTKYVLSIGTESKEGNRSFVETTFSTAEKE